MPNIEITIDNSLYLSFDLIKGEEALLSFDKASIVDLDDSVFINTIDDQVIEGSKTFSDSAAINELTFLALTNTVDDITEGSTNLFYTDVRAKELIDEMSSGDLSFSYNELGDEITSTIEAETITLDKLASGIDATTVSFNAATVDSKIVDDSVQTSNNLWSAAKIVQVMQDVARIAFWQQGVLAITGDETAIASPAEGDRYFIDVGTTGAFVGHDEEIATFDDGVWVFEQMQEGTMFFVEAESVHYAWLEPGFFWSVSGNINHSIMKGKQGNGEHHLNETQHTELTTGVDAGTNHSHTTSILSGWTANFGSAFNTNLASKTTDDLIEGVTNLWFTEQRVEDRSKLLLKDAVDNSLVFDLSTPGEINAGINISAFNSDQISEGTTNVFFSEERVSDRLKALVQNGFGAEVVSGATEVTYNIDLSVFNTDQVAEGISNLYMLKKHANIGTGNLIEAVATESISEGSFVNYYEDAGGFKVRKAVATEAIKFANGYVTETYAAGNTCSVYKEGFNNKLSGLVVGDYYLLTDTPGVAAHDFVPADNQISQEVGVAIDTNTIYVEFDEPIEIYS